MPTKAQIEAALVNADAAGDVDAARALANALKRGQYDDAADWRGRAGAVLKGATLGLGERASAGLAAGAAALGGADFGEAYSDIRRAELERQQSYADANPGESFGLELAGGVLTGGMTGAKAIPALAGRMSKGAATAAVGAAQGGVYGAATAKEGEALKGGLIGGAVGGVAAPIAGRVVDLAGKGVGALAVGARNAIRETPDAVANRVIRTVGDLTPDEAAARYASGGSQYTLMDVDENIAGLARAARDKGGSFKRQAAATLEARQMGSGERLKDAAQQATGARADDFRATVSQIKADREAKASPLYEQAWQEGAAHLQAMGQATGKVGPSDAWASLLDRPAIKAAIRNGVTIAKDLGDDPKDNVMKTLHYAKMALDARIEPLMRSGAKTKARSLLQAKRELLDLMDSVSPSYKQARDIFAGDSALLDAAKNGRNFLRIDYDDMQDVVQGMSQSELQMFRLGAVKEIADTLDDTGLTHDAARKLVGTRALQKKLSVLFDSPADAERFLRSAISERRMSMTRNTVMGGSQTSTNIEAGKALEQGIQPGAIVGALMNPKAAAAMEAARLLLGKKKVTPEVLDALSNKLLAQGLTPNEVRNIFTQPAIERHLARINGPAISNSLRGSAVPALNAFAQ